MTSVSNIAGNALNHASAPVLQNLSTGGGKGKSSAPNPLDWIKDSVSLSAGAVALLAANAGPQKDFGTVTREARAHLDAKYADLKSKGTPFSNTAGRFDLLLEDFDRRSLYAISSNSGGLFSEEEQGWASSVMGQQQGAAMEAASPLDPFNPARSLASIKFLNGVSAEEKMSVQWAVQMAASIYGYQEGSRRAGQEPEPVDSTDPLVKMILGAMRALENQAPRAVATGAPVKNLEDMPLFKDGVPSYPSRVVAA
jgi:hypothetical protein